MDERDAWTHAEREDIDWGLFERGINRNRYAGSSLRSYRSGGRTSGQEGECLPVGRRFESLSGS